MNETLSGGNRELIHLRRFRYLALAASTVTYLLIVMGGVVRVTGSGLGCPDWPLCHGQVIPPPRLDAWLEYLHRLFASLTSPLILLAALTAWRRFRSIRLIFRPLLLAVALLFIEIALGAVTVLQELPPLIVAVHLGVALTIFAMLLTATVTAFHRCQEPAAADRLVFQEPFARLSLWTLAGVFAVLISGAVVAGSGATAVCAGWPLCNGFLFPTNPLAWIHMLHRFIVAAASVLVILLVVRAWRAHSDHTVILPAATLSAALFFAQAYIGALKTSLGYPVLLLAMHVATAAAVWAALVVTAVQTGLSPQIAEAEQKTLKTHVSTWQRIRDLLSMTRPVVTLLLLVTAFGGLVLGSGGWPAPGLTVWTLLGGALAAGGAQAVNQYVDRDIDLLMKRTAKRPIPSGRLKPAQGLAWGLLLCTLSVFILAGLVNGLAALLTLAGILYYVVIYTLLLKRTSVQNIVIGGGAGAMAPVVGWAAATGRLGLPALYLFLVVFMWTPPHFWALALVRFQDYSRAGVPMMPVVRGEQVTRAQILWYSLGLLVITFLPTLFGMMGLLYLAVAVLLGLFLLYAVWKVWKLGGNQNAWRLYRVSSMYLAFLFMAMMLDVLV
ncbi:MAG: protoheme IX farnesyltransferase [Anaerolineae bacterium]|nr:protoheme IX farnesyltransferase [Anaerolineae bacterium]